MSITHKWYGDKAKRRAHDGAAKGLKAAAEHLLATSQPLVPVDPLAVDSGRLMRSGEASVDESALHAAVSYDGPVAVRQHESMEWHHPRAGAQAKYLEGPLNSEKDTLRDLIRDHVKSKLGA